MESAVLASMPLRKGFGNDEGSIRTSVLTRRIEIYIDRPIDEAELFRDEIHAIRSASAGDDVVLYINTPGGYIHTTKSLINSILLSEASVSAVVEGTVCSAGTIIACACPRVQVMPHTTFMIHSAHGGMYGTIRNALAHAEHEKRSVEGLMRDVYKNFLTDEELESVFEGKEIWLSAIETQDRFNTRVDLYAAQRAAQADEENLDE